ncbi:hypothetical protein VPH35_096629 [Triticum aestivum]
MVAGHWSDNGQAAPPLLVLRAASFDPGAPRYAHRLYLRCSPASSPPSALALGAAAGCAPRARRLPRWPRPGYLRLRVDTPSSPSRLAAAPAAAPCPWRASELPPATAPPLDTCSAPAGFSRLARAAPSPPAPTGRCWPRLASRASSRPPAGPRPAVGFPARVELSTPRLCLLAGSPPSRRPPPRTRQLRLAGPPSPSARPSPGPGPRRLRHAGLYRTRLRRLALRLAASRMATAGPAHSCPSPGHRRPPAPADWRPRPARAAPLRGRLLVRRRKERGRLPVKKREEKREGKSPAGSAQLRPAVHSRPCKRNTMHPATHSRLTRKRSVRLPAAGQKEIADR